MTMHTRVQLSWGAVCIAILWLVASPVWSGPVKDDKTCGCAADAYAVYGAGQDKCATFLEEVAANPDSRETDASFGQTLGWIAGYMSATNRQTSDRDVYSTELDYTVVLIAQWCEANPDLFLADALDAFTDKKLESNQLFSAD